MCFIFLKKPTLASLASRLYAFEYLSRSPSLTPSVVKNGITLVVYFVSPVPFLLLRSPLKLWFRLNSPRPSPLISSPDPLCIFHSNASAPVVYVYLWVFVAWLIITAVIITYRHNWVMVNMTECSPPRNAVSIVNATGA